MKNMRRYKAHRRITALLLASSLAMSAAPAAQAYDAAKVLRSGLVLGDLATWTQRPESFSQNKAVSVNGYSPLSTMGCSYYATFFMLCKMGIKSPLRDTAWQLAEECRQKGLCREGTGYFDPRSISQLTDGRVQFVEEGNASNYYLGQAAVGNCKNWDEVNKLVHDLMENKGYFLIACATGNVTNYKGEEYYSEGHYFFIDSISSDDWLIGDSAFPGTVWSDNWGAHGDNVAKIYAYKLLDDDGKQVWPSQRQSIYIVRSEEED